MSDAAIFIAVFAGLLVVRVIAATIIFCVLLPEGDRCPMCDAPTLRVQSRGWNALMPWLRTSWCYVCGWEGMLRHGPVTPPSAGDLPRPSTARDAAQRRR